VGLFKSTNKGATWSQITLGSEVVAQLQGNYVQTVGVDPQNTNYVYFGLRSLFLATDGGASGIYDGTQNPSEPHNNRIDLNKVHADQHALVFSPASHFTGPAPTRVYNGTDGGIATTADAGTNWSVINAGIGTILFNQIDIGRGSTANNAYTYGAAQDLGISQHRLAPSDPDFTGNNWLLGIGADGTAVAVDPLNATNAIGVSGFYTQSTSDGKSWPTPNTANIFPANAAFCTLAFDPNGGVAYALGTQLYQSTNNGTTFKAIYQFPAQITAFGMTTPGPNTIWVGLGDGTVQRTSNALSGASSSWAPHTIPNGPGGNVSGIAVDPANTSQAVVVYPANSQQVFLTTDNGLTWTNISGDLPNLPVNAVVIDPNTSPHTIIVANDTGVLRSGNLGASWERLGVGLPNVQCTSLAIDSTAVPSLLRVGTYGRSAWELAYDRQYVDWRNGGTQDGTREHPFRTVAQALNAIPSGDARYLVIQAGNYPEAPLTNSQCGTWVAINGAVTIH
jgi:hypothetical protein